MEWLEEHRIPVDGIAGTSAGAIVGGWYSTGIELLTDEEIQHPGIRNSPADMKLHGVADILNKIDFERMFRAYPDFSNVDVEDKEFQRDYPFGPVAGIRQNRLTFTDGIVPGNRLEAFFQSITSEFPTSYLYQGSGAPFDRLPTPFRSVAAQPHGYDLLDWERLVLGGQQALPKEPDYHVSLPDAIRASIAIPLIFTPRFLPPFSQDAPNGRYELVDGGVKDNFPTDVACDAFNPDVIIGLHIFVDLTPLSDVFSLGGHPRIPMKLQDASNSFKFGATQEKRPDKYVIQMNTGGARPDRFDDWRHLAYLGYKSMDRYASLPDGKKLLQLSLPYDEYMKYRQARRLRRQAGEAWVAEHPKNHLGDSPIAAIASKTGVGSVSQEGESIVQHPRSLGKVQFFSALDASAGTGDRSIFDERVMFRSFGAGSRYSSLTGQFDLGTDSEARIDYNYVPDRGSWFFKPYLVADSLPQTAFQNGRRIGGEQIGEQKGGLEVGILSHANLRISAASEVGNLSFDGNHHFLQNLAQITYDDTGSVEFPSRGAKLDAYVRDLSLGAGLPSVYQSDVNGEYRVAISDSNTLILQGGAGTSFGAHPADALQFSLGGVGLMKGYPVDWVRTPGYGYESATFGVRIERLPFYLGSVRWLTGVELAQTGSGSLQDAFSGLLISSRLGQLFTGVTTAQGFRPRLIITFGSRPFRQTPLFGMEQ